MSVPGESSTEFADYGEIVRRRWPLIALGLLLGVGLAILGLHVVQKTYTSVALVQVRSVATDTSVANGRTASALNLDTEAQLVTSNDVASRAKELLGVTTTALDLSKNVSVTVPPNTSVLKIGFSASDPERARAGAQAFAEAYLANRREGVEQDLKAQASAIRDQIADAKRSLVASNKRLAPLAVGSPARADEEATNSALNTQLRDLQSALVPLTRQDVNPGVIITDAQVPQQASNPNPRLLLASGLLAGLMLGCLFAVIVDRLDRRVRGRKDLERLGLDALTGVVRVPAVRDGGTPLVNGPGAEALRQLRNALLAQIPHRAGSVLVANASDPEGGSAVSVSLAVTLARSGLDVVLLSANTVSCAVELAFGIEDRPGLVDVLRGRGSLQQCLVEIPDIPHLQVVAAGRDGSLSSELLQGPKIEAVLRELGEVGDMVVVDVAPTSSNADAQTLATATDGVLLVATALKTEREQVLESVDQLRHVSARAFGSVVVSVNRERRAAAGSVDSSNGASADRPKRKASRGIEDRRVRGSGVVADLSQNSGAERVAFDRSGDVASASADVVGR